MLVRSTRLLMIILCARKKCKVRALRFWGSLSWLRSDSTIHMQQCCFKHGYKKVFIFRIQCYYTRSSTIGS